MKMFKNECIILLLIGIALETSATKFNNSNLISIYDEPDDPGSLICYSTLDKSRVVRCKTACVQKTLITRYKIRKEYEFDFHYRIGCESTTYTPTLRSIQCSSDKRNGQNYEVEYSIKGNDNRNPRVFIRKKCCFHSYCNEPDHNFRRYWYQRKKSMIVIMREKYSSRHILPYFVLFLVISLTIYGVLSMILSWVKAKKEAESGEKCRELEQELIAESPFLEGSIQETGIELTGRLTLKETSYLLAHLPDHDIVKDSRMKSMSTEESTKEMKTTKLIKAVESKAAVGGKSLRKVFIKPPLKSKAAGWGHNIWKTVRTINSPNDLLYRMIEHGPYQYPFTALELLSLFEETASLMSNEPSLLQIEADITVIGDIRGKYVDLHRWLQLTGWPPQNRILFLGGIIDSEEAGSVECLALICSLKCRFPKHVFILRGEPEVSPFHMSERLHPVITRAVQSCIRRMCSHIPFAAIIGKSVLAVYSGFSPMIREKAHIHNLFRPVIPENLNSVERHIIFNQPSSQVKMYRPNPNAEGDFFGKQAVIRACKAMKCNVMIRGQSYVPFGYLPCWNNRLINLWSAPGYGSNYGAVLHVSKELIITPILMEKQQN
ncbi:hypothetical protein CAEBREN_03156 [Caenorhabditis brenneri]|uniref:Serine/threonine specific protein phosphatases domain-containing protein n=1 Tax=Caenorhabditis brenneri TaxID=135651 RepID=G0MQ20_CAEBE|nr:hypothetical protein CAEBREN_03156 [Caenorhabditis brenneri]